MKICISYYEGFDNPWRVGGGLLNSWEIGQRLARRGHKVRFVSGNFPGARQYKWNGVDHTRVGLTHPYMMSVLSYYLMYPLCLKRIERECDVLLEGWTSPFPFTPLWFKKPVVAWVHILLSSNAFKELGVLGLPNFLSEKIFKTLYDNYILYSSHYVDLEKTRRVLVCPPGFDQALLSLKREEEDYLLFLGRLAAGGVYQKGLDMLFACFGELRKSFPTLRLVVGGNGDSKAVRTVQRMSRDIGGVQFMGKVGGRMKNELIRKCLLVCMPSRFESAGIVALEAQACGKPVVGFNILGLNSVVKNGETGILVKPFELQELTNAIASLLQDRQKRTEYGENGRRWAAHFTWDKATDLVEEFLISLV